MTSKKLECATIVMDTIPQIMHVIVSHWQNGGRIKATVHQMRALDYIGGNEGANLSSVSEHLKATLSSTSKLIDVMIRDGLVTCTTGTADRRQKLLALTPQGLAFLHQIHAASTAYLAGCFESLSEHECELVALAMKVLISAFTPGQTEYPKFLKKKAPEKG